MSAPFGTVTQCSVEPTVPKCALIKLQNSSKFCFLVDILEKLVSASVIGRLPIFFHDQTIFIKDCELYTVGHSLVYGNIEKKKFRNLMVVMVSL